MIMKKAHSIILSVIATLLFACNSTRVHHAKFYNKLGEQAEQEGFHHNEAQRVIDLNEINKDKNQEKSAETKLETSNNLNILNKPNTYNSAPQKVKKKRFTFYL